MDLIAILRWITIGAAALWFVVYWKAGLRIVEEYRQTSSRYDRGVMIIIGIFSVLMFIFSVLVAASVLKVPEVMRVRAVTWVGFGLFWAGIAGMIYSRAVLESFWKTHARQEDDSSLVNRGPYRWVRHPFYFSAILMYLGLALVFPVWMNGVCLVVIIAAYTQKTRDEEQYLQENLSGYQEYSKEVIYRFIPRIW